MKLIDLIIDKYKSVSIVGLAKNAGKTVTLNKLIEEAYESELLIGITSTGRDGESTDVLTNTEKPTIYASKGTIITTTTKLLNLNNANIEIIDVTDYRSPLGNIVIGKVKEDGYVQIAGPQNNKEIKEIVDILINLGAKLVLVDGSINRISCASPIITEGTILASGAIVSRDMNKVIEETIHTSNLFSLNKVSELDNCILEDALKNNISIIDKNNNIKYLDLKTAIKSGKTIAENIDDNTKYIVFKGSLVKKTIEDIFKSTKNRNFKILVKDSTKIFINSRDWITFKRQGLEIEVIDKINLILITLNPYSPYGYYFDSEEFLSKTKAFIKDIPVVDVMKI